MRKKTKKVYGIGVNDADYPVMPVVDGVQKICPYYLAWKNMLGRAFSKKYHDRKPTYIDVTICEEWLSFMTFKEWMESQDWGGFVLDKDILVRGNKEYSPDRCCFVTNEVNNLLHENDKTRGRFPCGVGLNRYSGKYCAQIQRYGKNTYIGLFETVNEASQAYKKAKKAHIETIAAAQTDARIRDGLLRHADLLAA